MTTNIHKVNGFIYVTSEDEIKPMDWIIGVVGTLMCVSTKAFQTYEKLSIKPNWSKIILTNDKTLTNVQQLTQEEEAYCKTVDSVKTYYVPKNIFKDDDGWEYQLQLPKQEQVLIQSSIDGDVIWREGCTEAVKTLYTEEDMRIAFKEGFDAHYEDEHNRTIQEKEDIFIEKFNQNKKK